jgi:cold shock protein
MAAPTNGTIKRLVSEKGFGFVAASDGSEYFFHQSACNGCQFDSLREGQAVTFEKGQGPKGPRAENVRLAESTGFRLKAEATGFCVASAFRRKNLNEGGG